MAKYNELAYASAVTRVRAIQNRQLDKIAAEKMITAKTESEAIQVLTDLGWAGADDYETMLKQEMSRTISLVEELGGGSVLRIFRVKYDFHNLKVLIKSQLLGTDEDDMLIRYGNYKVDTLRQALLDRDYRALAPKVAEAIESVFDHYARLKDSQMIDLVLDKAMFEIIVEYAYTQPDEMVLDLVRTQIDLYNIKTFIRIRNINKSYYYMETAITQGGYIPKKVYLENAAVPADKVDNVFAYTPYSEVFSNDNNIESALDGYFDKKRWQIKLKAFGLAPLYDFLLSKEREIKIARIIFICKNSGISPDVIRNRLPF